MIVCAFFFFSLHKYRFKPYLERIRQMQALYDDSLCFMFPRSKIIDLSHIWTEFDECRRYSMICASVSPSLQKRRFEPYLWRIRRMQALYNNLCFFFHPLQKCRFEPYLERIRRMQALYNISTVFIATQDARILLAAKVCACCSVLQCVAVCCSVLHCLDVLVFCLLPRSVRVAA